MAIAHNGNALPVYMYGRRVLLFPENENRVITYNFQAPGKGKTKNGYPKLYWQTKFILTEDLSSNITCVIGLKTAPTGEVLNSEFSAVTRYINRSVFPSAVHSQPYRISLCLSSVFSNVVFGRSIDFDMSFMRAGTSSDDSFPGCLTLLNSKIWWAPTAAATETNVFATLAV